MENAGPVSLLAPAKLNLTLQVFGKRPDGYHDIRSLMVPISLYDEVTVERTGGGIEVESDKGGVPAGLANSCGRAAARFLDRVGLPGGVRIRIRKAIPMEAGLGGGSSDAAATLRAMAVLAGREPSPAEMAEMAASVGADVPFFLAGGAAFAEGFGERITPVDWKVPFHAVVVKPAFGLPTAEGYARLGREPGPPPGPAGIAVPHDWEGLAACVSNDFEAAWADARPEIAAIKGELLAAGASAAAMTGSGSALFGLFRDGEGAARAQGALARDDGRTVFLARNI